MLASIFGRFLVYISQLNLANVVGGLQRVARPLGSSVILRWSRESHMCIWIMSIWCIHKNIHKYPTFSQCKARVRKEMSILAFRGLILSFTNYFINTLKGIMYSLSNFDATTTRIDSVISIYGWNGIAPNTNRFGSTIQ